MLAIAETLEPTLREAARALTGRDPARIERLPGGASLRRYYRLHVPGGEPPSLIAMELGEAPVSEEAQGGAVPAELPFIDVLRYLERGGVAVPRLYRYDAPAGLLYLEDLGDATLESYVAEADDRARRHYYGLALAELSRMQRYAAEHPSGCVAFSRGFDYELLFWELEHFREWGLEAGAGAALRPAEREELSRQFRGIAERLAAEPRGFVHRDYQSRNLMVQAEGGAERVRVIDFQDALLGTRAYDLVALLRDSYVVLSPPLLDQLVADYAALAGLDLGSFRRLFDLQTVQRKLKDAGRFVYIDRVKKNPGFLPYIPTSHAYVRAALERLPELGSLHELLARHLSDFR